MTTIKAADFTNFIGTSTPYYPVKRGRKRDRRATRRAGDGPEPTPREKTWQPTRRPRGRRRSVPVSRRADEQRGQEREDVRLQEGYEEFQEAQGDHAGDARGRHDILEHPAHPDDEPQDH